MTDQPASFTGVHLLTLMRQYKAVRREALLLATGGAVRHDGGQAMLAALCAADGIVDQLERSWGLDVDDVSRRLEAGQSVRVSEMTGSDGKRVITIENGGQDDGRA